MSTVRQRMYTLLIACLASFALATALDAQDSGAKSPLSEKIRQVIEEQGAEDAERWFREYYPTEKDQYEPDYRGFTTLAQEYMEAGDYASGTTVMTIMSQVAIESAPAAAAMASAPPAETTAKQQTPEAPSPFPVPEARDDLERFYGLYVEPGEAKGLIVTEMCGGYLFVTTTWGDASPWLMYPVADSEFEYSDSWISLAIRFLPDSGEADSLEHDLDALPSPLPRAGPRPQGWEKCIPDTRG